MSFYVRIAVLSHHSGATRQLAPAVGLEPTGDCSQRFSGPLRYQLRFTLANSPHCYRPCGRAVCPCNRCMSALIADNRDWRCVEVSIPLCVSAGFGLANRPLTFRATHHICRRTHPPAGFGVSQTSQTQSLYPHLFGSRSPLVACLPPSHYGLFGVALRRVTIAIGLFSVRLSEGSDPALRAC